MSVQQIFFNFFLWKTKANRGFERWRIGKADFIHLHNPGEYAKLIPEDKNYILCSFLLGTTICSLKGKFGHDADAVPATVKLTRILNTTVHMHGKEIGEWG